MTTENWITIITAIFGIGLTVGSLRSTMGALATEFREFKVHVHQRLDRIDLKLEQTNGHLSRGSLLSEMEPLRRPE